MITRLSGKLRIVHCFIDPYFMAQGYWEFARWMMKPAHYTKQFHPTIQRVRPGKIWKRRTSGGSRQAIRVSSPGVLQLYQMIAKITRLGVTHTTGVLIQPVTNCLTLMKFRWKLSLTSKLDPQLLAG